MNEQADQNTDMLARGRELMQKRRIMSRTELDAELASLASSIPADEKTGAGRNRRKNLVDWVKARWTEHGITKKVKIGTEVYYVWWERAGHVRGVDLLSKEEATVTFAAVLKFLGAEML